MRTRRNSDRHSGELSMWQPVHLGVDEAGYPVRVVLAERNLLVGGEPGSGKSSVLNLVAAHAALSSDCDLILIDGKQVELGPWRGCASRFVGPSLTDAIDCLTELQAVMDARYAALFDAGAGRRKLTPGSGERLIVLIVDEVAYFTATVGGKKEQDAFKDLSRDIVARGRAAGIIPVIATQRPSADIVPTSLRDLFAYRWAMRCTTEASSDVILGHGWAGQRYVATDIDPMSRGVGWLLAEGGIPQRVKAAYLCDADVAALAAHAVILRAGHGE